MRTVLDIYDDPHAIVLRRCLHETGIALPEKLASTELLEPSDLNKLPDHLFALVENIEGSVLRKYAMHDEGHLATSITYFLECGDVIPGSLRSKAAERLVNACAWYETEPPGRLVKIAIHGKVAAGRTTMEGAAPPAMDELDAFVLQNGDLESRYAKLNTGYDNPFARQKKADITGTSLGAQGVLSKDPRPPTPESKGLSDKTAYALPHHQKYPIRDVGEVKRAMAYFDTYAAALDTADRDTFARNVAMRAAELGVKVAGKIAQCTGTQYGNYIAAELTKRAYAYAGTKFEELYGELSSKQAMIEPADMVALLAKTDAVSGASDSYCKPAVGFMAPALAVFGKSADVEPWSWTQAGHYVNKDILDAYVNRSTHVDHIFGDGFTVRLAKDPVVAFESLAPEQKVILSRLASISAYRS